MMTKPYQKRLIGLVIAIMLVWGAFPASVNAQDFVQLATVSPGVSALNVRSGPGAQYPVLRWLVGGQQIGLIGRTADASWVQLQSYDGQTVEWVSANYVTAYEDVMTLPVTGGQTTPPASQTVQLATVSSGISALNVRSGPGAQYPVLRWLVGGQQIGLIGRTADAGWVQLQPYDGQRVEWIDADYVTTYENVLALPVTGGQTTPPASQAVQLATVSASIFALNVRSGPGVQYPVLRWLVSGQQIGLVGRTADASWLQLQSYDGLTVEWVSAHYVTAYENVMTLPVTGG